MRHSFFAGCWRKVLCLPLLLGGCAQLPPELPPRPTMAMPSTQASLAALMKNPPPSVSPADTRFWWQVFHEPELDALIGAALRQQPDMDAAQARLTAALQAERLARLATGLQYSTDVSVNRERLSDNGLFPTALVGKMYTQTDITQSVAVDLDLWGKRRSLLRAARSEQLAAQDEQAAVRLSLSAAVADAYFSWAGACRLREQAGGLLAQHRQMLTLAEQRHRLGLEAAAPVVEARRRLSLDEERVKQYDYLAVSARYRLAALTGADPDHAADMKEPRLASHLPPLPERLSLDWLARRPDIASLGNRIEAASERSEAARAAFYPDIDLRLLAGFDTLDAGKLFDAGSVAGGLGAAVHLPLFNQRTLQAQLGLREAEYAAAVAAYNKAILEGARQAADAQSLNLNLEARASSQASANAEVQQLHKLAALRYRMGLSGPMETLNAESVELTQQMAETELQTSRLRARVALYRALGGAGIEESR